MNIEEKDITAQPEASDTVEKETSTDTKKKKKQAQQSEQFDIDSINIDDIITQQQKEFTSVVKKLEDFVVKQGSTPVLHTGIPTLDICLGGGIPSKRMTYLWGGSLTGKTTLCFEIAHHNFLRLAYTGLADTWRFVFLDAEEGESKKWITRIGTNFPYKYDVPENIEDLEPYLRNLKKEFSGQELFVIWDSVSATRPKSITGRADIARATTQLLNHIKLTELEITLMTINQQREKQEQYAPSIPPAGNALRHKSHLTLHSPSIAKSDFWKDKRNGRSILWRTQKARDSFNDIDFRMEMTYFSGFDAVLTFLYVLWKEQKVIKRRVDTFTISVDDELKFVSGDKDNKTEYIVNKKDLADFDIKEKEIEGLQNLYEFFFTEEAEPYWRFGLRYFAYQTFKPYFLYQDDKFTEFLGMITADIEKYYLSNWKLFIKTMPTRMTF